MHIDWSYVRSHIDLFHAHHPTEFEVHHRIDENANEEVEVVHTDGSVHHGGQTGLSQPESRRKHFLSRVKPIVSQSQA